MKSRFLFPFSALFFVLISIMSPVYSASFQKAEMLNEVGLTRESKIELVEVIFGTSTDVDKAKAYFLLGSIAFSENKTSVALESWRTLSKKFPSSKEAGLVKDRIRQLSEISGEVGKELVENAIAQSYLKHGDFWSKGKDYKFTVDNSWIQSVEAAITWYDKVIKDFPNSSASRVAYEEKMRTLIGWKDIGRDGETFGIKRNFSRYMPQLLETFAAFEKENPSASSIQAFRYQIAQAYWGAKDWAKTREWLNLIIERAGETDGFYKETAKLRLQKIEY
jgi:hypothetical protein